MKRSEAKKPASVCRTGVCSIKPAIDHRKTSRQGLRVLDMIFDGDQLGWRLFLRFRR